MKAVTVNLSNHQRTIRIRKNELAAVLSRATAVSPLRTQLDDDDDLVVNLLGKRRMARINRDYVGHRGPTDVISFGYLEDADAFPGVAHGRTIGELFICPAVAADRVAAGDGLETVGEEVVLYGVHGILHVAGFDDLLAADIKQMRAAEAELMAALRTDFDLPAVASMATGRQSKTKQIQEDRGRFI